VYATLRNELLGVKERLCAARPYPARPEALAQAVDQLRACVLARRSSVRMACKRRLEREVARAQQPPSQSFVAFCEHVRSSEMTV
jgi:hypothetical protein